MGDIPEDKFTDDFVVPWLQTRFPHAAIDREKWLGNADDVDVTDPTNGYADVWIRTPCDTGVDPGIIAAVEVGNDDTVRDEVAQAVEYASVNDRAVPYVVIPADHADGGVVQTFRCRGVVVVELSTTDPA
jgi:hypothetical protein